MPVRQGDIDMVRRLEALDPDSFGLPCAAELLEHVVAYVGMAVTGLHDPDSTLASALAVSSQSLAGSTLPQVLAATIFDDASLVFDVRERLRGEPYPNAALWEPPPGFGPSSHETLVGFMRRNPRCVVVFDDAQAFAPAAIETLAGMCDEGVAQDAHRGVKVSARGVIVLATLRADLPSASALESGWPGRRTSGERLEEEAVTAALEHEVERRFPRHYSTWVRSRFRCRPTRHLWHAYETALAEGRRESPLLVVADPRATPWDGRPPRAPFPDARDLVEDVDRAIPPALPGKAHDVFISYRTTRNARLAQWLAAELRARGLAVWLDADTLPPDHQPAGRPKADLIHTLVAAVRASRCTIAFAAGLEPYVQPEGMSNDEALRRGAAMRTGDGIMVKWSWQKLELDFSQDVVVVDETSGHVYAVRDGRKDSDFDAFDSDQRFLELVLGHLRRLRVL